MPRAASRFAQSMYGCVIVPHAYCLKATVSVSQRLPKPSSSFAQSPSEVRAKP